MNHSVELYYPLTLSKLIDDGYHNIKDIDMLLLRWQYSRAVSRTRSRNQE